MFRLLLPTLLFEFKDEAEGKVDFPKEQYSEKALGIFEGGGRMTAQQWCGISLFGERGVRRGGKGGREDREGIKWRGGNRWEIEGRNRGEGK